jgi:hypothetical protein
MIKEHRSENDQTLFQSNKMAESYQKDSAILLIQIVYVCHSEPVHLVVNHTILSRLLR